MEVIDAPYSLPEDENNAANLLIEEYLIRRKSDYKWIEKQRAAGNAEYNDALGKKGEFVAYSWLRYRGRDLTGLRSPDTSLHTVKRFDPDLGCFHVKSAEPFRDELSWTFQKGDLASPGGRDPLLVGLDETPIIFVQFLEGVGWKHRESRIALIAKPSEIIPLLRDPIKPQLKGLKACLYFDDVLMVTI